MKLLFTSQDRILIYHLKNLLEQHSIDCLLKNEFLGSAATEIPFFECWPELWVCKRSDYKTAQALLQTAKNGVQEQGTTHWTCQRCGEEHEAQFSHCWQCQEKTSPLEGSFSKHESELTA